MTNIEIAKLLRKVAAAYVMLDEDRFKIIAYERAADSIEHLSSDAKDVWDDDKLDTISGVGGTIRGHLDELFRTGTVKHFENTFKRVPNTVFPLLDIPGLGPKKAYKLVTALHLEKSPDIIKDLTKEAKLGHVAPLDGFGEKSQEQILSGIELFAKGALKENRMILPEAEGIAELIIGHMKTSREVLGIEPLGSLRRKVSTVGDIDIGVATKRGEKVLDHFLTYPHAKLIERGPAGASVLLKNGRQVDLRVCDPSVFGSMMQYFTGSKNHNIALRTLALSKGWSLSEYGLKRVSSGKITPCPDEKVLYGNLGLSYIPPELREDQGEIQGAMEHDLPDLVNTIDIRGDLHLHTSYNLEPSHDLGADSLATILKKAELSLYEYIGISDHNPSIANHTEKQIISIMKERKAYYEHQYSSYTKSTQSKRIHLLIMLETDILPDGKLALPKEAFASVDGVIASIHSSFMQTKEEMTKRVTTALNFHPKVRIFGHPTGRLLGKREGYELDWGKIFDVCRKRDIALEINAHFMRLDLPDVLVREAIRHGVKLVIDTDSHAADQMYLMKYGVSVARRGWATKHDIMNTRNYAGFRKWLLKE